MKYVKHVEISLLYQMLKPKKSVRQGNGLMLLEVEQVMKEKLQTPIV